MKCIKCEDDMSLHTPLCQAIEDSRKNKKCLCNQTSLENNVQTTKVRVREKKKV